MPECFLEKVQFVQNDQVNILKASEMLEMNAFLISPFHSGFSCNIPLPSTLTNNSYLTSKHLNLFRSLPYKSLKSVIF